ncbi:MAG: SPOR domain-containing protein [Candidatus Zixiibacteriota bacterium]
MKLTKIIIIFGLTALLSGGCKKDADDNKQALVPPIDTTHKLVTTPSLDIDTMPAVEELPGMPPAPPGNGFAVQVASASDQKYARYILDLWRGRGYEPFVTNVTQDGVTHYRIRLGYYESHAQAKKIADEVADKYSLKPWIDHVTN